MKCIQKLDKGVRWKVFGKGKDTANIFMFTEPLSGYRYLSVTEHRTTMDWAYEIKNLLELHYPQAQRIRLGQSSLDRSIIKMIFEMDERSQVDLAKNFGQSSYLEEG